MTSKRFSKPLIHPNEFSEYGYTFQWADGEVHSFLGNKYQLLIYTTSLKYTLSDIMYREMFARKYETIQDIKVKIAQYNYKND